MSGKLYLIGITPGRSGSKSFAQFMDKQKDCSFSHEGCQLGFWPIFDTYPRALKTLKEKEGKIVGDIAPFWVMYLDRVVRDLGRANVRIVWLTRANTGQIVTSFDAYKKFDIYHPKGAYGQYPIHEKKYSRDAIARTVDVVNWLCYCAESQFGDIMAYWEMHELNKRANQRAFLKWLGIPEEDHVYGMDRVNVRSDRIRLQKEKRNQPPEGFDAFNPKIGTDEDEFK